METIPWEVRNAKFTDGYIAGFLDGDGSIVAVAERSGRRRFPYRIKLRINFTQHIRYLEFMRALQATLGGIGWLRKVSSRNLVELVVIKRSDLEALLRRLLPHLIVKRRQAEIALSMVDVYNANLVKVRSSLSEKDFARLLAMAKRIRNLNSGSGGKQIIT